MSTRTPARREAEEQVLATASREVLDKPPRRWSVPLLVLVAALLGMGAGAWVAGNNERALEATTERLLEVSERLDAARGEIATARDDLTNAQAEITRLQGAERVALEARRDHAAAQEDLEQAVDASAELFDSLPAGATAGLAPDPRDWALLQRSFSAANAGDEAGYRDTFTPDGRLTLVTAGMRNEFRGDGIESAVSPRPHLRFVGAPAQAEELVWSRYVESDSSGVAVTRLQGNRILHQWLVALSW